MTEQTLSTVSARAVLAVPNLPAVHADEGSMCPKLVSAGGSVAEPHAPDALNQSSLRPATSGTKRLTPELSRAAKRLRLERIVRPRSQPSDPSEYVKEDGVERKS
jgi:hypothetical protein